MEVGAAINLDSASIMMGAFRKGCIGASSFFLGSSGSIGNPLWI
jgi:hypothetical protein